MRYLGLLVLVSVLPVRASSTAPITVEMTEFAFRPAMIRVSAGRSVTLRLINRGQIAHQFVTDVLRTRPVIVTNSRIYVETPGLDVLRLQPGESATLTFTAGQRGRFPFACTIEGHRERGMEGVLEVR